MSHSASAVRLVPEPLPATTKELVLHRLLKSHQTLNDRVEVVLTNLIESDDFRGFLEAVYDEQAIEGSLAADNFMAAKLIRDRALKMGDHVLGREKLASISKSLNVCLKRYGFSRKERRDTAAGQIVKSEGGE